MLHVITIFAIRQNHTKNGRVQDGAGTGTVLVRYGYRGPTGTGTAPGCTVSYSARSGEKSDLLPEELGAKSVWGADFEEKTGNF